MDIVELKRLAEIANTVPENEPYVTANGGVILLSGPFPYPRALATANFYRAARTAVPELIDTIERAHQTISALSVDNAELRNLLKDASVFIDYDPGGKLSDRIESALGQAT